MSLANLLPQSADTYHHAYLIRGSSQGLFSVLETVFEVTEKGHPDLYLYQGNTLTLADARDICEKQSGNPVQAHRTLFVIDVDALDLDAQNTLLKVFEDPSPSTVFFLVLPERARVLPTLRSRVSEIKNVHSEHLSKISLDDFLSSSPAKRLTLVNPLIEKKEKREAERLLDAIEKAFFEDGRFKTEKGEDIRQGLDELYKCKKMLQNRGSSMKLILEYLSLRLPQLVI